MSKLTDKYFPYLGLYGIGKTALSREVRIEQYRRKLLIKSLQIFEWRGLPDTCPAWVIEIILQTNGNALFFKKDESLYIAYGGWGGKPDEYYRPTQYIVTNPYLEVSKTFDIKSDECVFISNDHLCTPLLDIIDRTATELADTDITIRMACITKRVQSIISATDDTTYESAKKFLSDLEKGELGAIMDDGLVESLHVSPYAHTGEAQITQLMELRQYQYNSFYNEIGIQASTNQKRENVSELEASQNSDYLLPYITDMLRCRKEAVEKLNRIFNLDVSVELSPQWERMQEEIEKGEEDEERDDSGKTTDVDTTGVLDETTSAE